MSWVPAIGDIVDVQIDWTLSTGKAQNHFGMVATGVALSVELMVTEWQTRWVKNTADGILYQHMDNASIGSITVHDVKPGTRAPYTKSFTPVAGNDGVGDSMAPQNAMVVTLRTLTKGRSYRGRVYLPCWKSSKQANGTWVAGATSATDAFMTSLFGYFGTGGTDPNYDLCVISRYLDGVKRVSPVATTVTSYTVQPVVYTQRRRTVGVGI